MQSSHKFSRALAFKGYKMQLLLWERERQVSFEETKEGGWDWGQSMLRGTHFDVWKSQCDGIEATSICTHHNPSASTTSTLSSSFPLKLLSWSQKKQKRKRCLPSGRHHSHNLYIRQHIMSCKLLLESHFWLAPHYIIETICLIKSFIKLSAHTF